MYKIISGAGLALAGACLILLNTPVTRLLLGGSPQFRRSVWIENQQVFASVSKYVQWSGWVLVLAGLVLLALGTVKLRHVQPQNAGTWL